MSDSHPHFPATKLRTDSDSGHAVFGLEKNSDGSKRVPGPVAPRSAWKIATGGLSGSVRDAQRFSNRLFR